MKDYYRRHLPHWHPQGAVFFVTFRLKDSIPHTVIELLRLEREREKLALQKQPDSNRATQNYLDEQRSFWRWDDYLDRGECGPHWLSQSEIADIVKEAFHYRDGSVFDLYAYCIMSNHVHAVFEPSRSDWSRSIPQGQSDLPLSKIMQSLKRHTARQANIVLGRQGAFWQDESYDHVIRDNAAFLRIIYYVVENPVKAGLVPKWEDWPWTYLKPGLL